MRWVLLACIVAGECSGGILVLDQQNPGDTFQTFVGRPLTFDCIHCSDEWSASSISWTVENATIVSQEGDTAVGVFNTIGNNWVTASSGANERAILVQVAEQVVDCYQWTACITNSQNTSCIDAWDDKNDGNYFIHLWLSTTGLSVVPSLKSTEDQSITSGMYNVGTSPIVEVVRKALMSQSQLDRFIGLDSTSVSFDTVSKHWSIPLRVHMQKHHSIGSVVLHVEAPITASMGCSASSKDLILNLLKFVPPIDTESSYEHFPIDSDRVQQDYCGNVFLSFSSKPGELWVSQTMDLRKDIHDRLHPLNFGVTDLSSVAHTRTGIAGVAEDRLYIVKGEYTNVTTLILPESLNRVSTVDGCDWDLAEENDEIIAWMDSALTSKFYSIQNGKIFTRNLDLEFLIHDILPLIVSPRILVLVSSESRFKIISWHRYTRFTQELFEFPDSLVQPYLVSPSLESGELLLWTSTLVMYSPNLGLNWETVPLYSFYASFMSYQPTPLGDDIIHQLTTSSAGQVALLTKEGRVFVGSLGMMKMYEVNSPASSTSRFTSLWYRQDDSLFLVVDDSSSMFSGSVNVYPVMTLQHKVIPDVSPSSTQYHFATSIECPFISWSKNIQRVVNLDMNESYSYTTELYHKNGVAISTAVQISDISIVEFSSSSEKLSVGSEVVQRLRTVDIKVPERVDDTSINKRSEYMATAGTVVLRNSPSKSSLQCNVQRSLVQLNVGCPLNRHLRLEPPDALGTWPSSVVSPSECDSIQDIQAKTRCVCQYKQQKMFLDQSDFNAEQVAMMNPNFNPSADAPFEFDLETATYGCPIYLPYTTKYLPKLAVYDGDIKVRDVNISFVVVEAKGRTHTTFSMTAGDALCSRAPSSFLSRLKSYGVFTAIIDVWNVMNYESCVSDVAPFDATAPYPVFGGSSNNRILFSKFSKSDAPFQYVAIIVDAGYSFCPLAVHFSVQPYGMPIGPVVTVVIVTMSLILSMLLLGCTYAYYRKEIHTAKVVMQLKKQL